MSKSLRVAVLSGGSTAEREVSLETGRAVSAALSERGHLVLAFDPRDTPVETIPWSEYDAAFIALHGAYGEDGQLQAWLEARGVPYNGSGPEASQVAFSKLATKDRFLACGVPTAPHRAIDAGQSMTTIVSLAEELGYPLVLKPDQQGSSVGVSLVRSSAALQAALAECLRFDSRGLLEQAVLGSEWTVAMFDDATYPPVAVQPEGDLFDYHAKYVSESTRRTVDGDLPASGKAALLTAARGAYAAVGAAGLARVDVRFNDRGEPFALEVNTIPGMTSHSLAPLAAAQAGVSFGELCERMVRAGIARHQSRWDR